MQSLYNRLPLTSFLRTLSCGFSHQLSGVSNTTQDCGVLTGKCLPQCLAQNRPARPIPVMGQPCSQWVESQRDLSELLCSLCLAVCGSAVCTDLLVRRPWGRLRVKKIKQLVLTVGSAFPFLCEQSWLSDPCPGEGSL